MENKENIIKNAVEKKIVIFLAVLVAILIFVAMFFVRDIIRIGSNYETANASASYEEENNGASGDTSGENSGNDGNSADNSNNNKDSEANIGNNNNNNNNRNGTGDNSNIISKNNTIGLGVDTMIRGLRFYITGGIDGKGGTGTGTDRTNADGNIVTVNGKGKTAREGIDIIKRGIQTYLENKENEGKDSGNSGDGKGGTTEGENNTEGNEGTGENSSGAEGNGSGTGGNGSGKNNTSGDTDVVVDYSDRIKIKDSNGEWNNQRELEIFKDSDYYSFSDRSIIAPGVSGKYSFTVENGSEVSFDYTIKFTEENPYNVNMVYKLKKNGKYVLGNENTWEEFEKLDRALAKISPLSSDVYTVEWKWEDTDYDTPIGQNKDSYYKVYVKVDAKQIIQ